jgi:hypothetical protein
MSMLEDAIAAFCLSQTGFFALNPVIWFSFILKKHKQGYYKTTGIQDHMKSARSAKYKC